MWWPLTVLAKTLSPSVQPSCSALPGRAAVPVSGTSYPMLIGLLALAGLLELLELQAASTSGVASRSANVPYRAELPRTLMYISLVGPRAWLLITSDTTM